MINILIADDHLMFCEGITSLLSTEKEINIVGCAENGIEVLKILKTHHIDIVLMDINMQKMDGIETTKHIVEKYPDVKVLMLTMYNNDEFIKQIIEIGAHGYILKNTGKDELILAIKSIINGGNYFNEEVKNTLIKSFRKKNKGEQVRLTPREKDVLKLICEEYNTAEIADKLFISINTVESHRKNLLNKTGVKNSVGLVKFAIDNKLI